MDARLAASWFISKDRSLCRSNVSFLIMSAKSVHRDNPKFPKCLKQAVADDSIFVKSIEDHFQVL
jgi:hypothetical protein